MKVTGVLWAGVRLDDDARPGKFERMDQPGTVHSAGGEIAVGP